MRWHAMGVEPPTGQTRNLSDRLPLLIAELQRGNRKFDDEEEEPLITSLCPCSRASFSADLASRRAATA